MRVPSTARVVLPPIALLAIVVAACIPPRPSTSPTPTATEAPPSPSATAGASTIAPTAGSSSGVAVDASLLHVLPSEVAGVAIKPDPETATEIADEGSVAPFVSALALAAAFGPPATDAETDYVVVTVAKLRPGTFSELFFRGWRDTFDAAVCEQAGGVAGHAEADIGGRHTYIGTCSGGVHTYHVHLSGQDLLVSMQGAGPGGWPEQIIRGITE